ncbi:hypothetical protein DFQ26_005806 [Actinomortierella ambigua]|nr:hypothetical protein DFQ26_005806 [Actinomortierella ambigua]
MAKKSTAGGRVEKASSAPKKALGTTALPAARIKRIIKEDKDVNMVSNDAVFLISLATELFLESFMSKAYGLAKMEKRKTVFYKDLATAVSQHDMLDFLQDVVPKTMPLADAIERQRKAKEQEENGVLDDSADQGANGQGDSDDESSSRLETPAGEEEEDDNNSLTGSAPDDLSSSGAEDMEED